MGMPAARLTDMHVCPMVTGIVPHVGGPIVSPGAPNTLIGGLPAARVSDMAVCVGPPDAINHGLDDRNHCRHARRPHRRPDGAWRCDHPRMFHGPDRLEQRRLLPTCSKPEYQSMDKRLSIAKRFRINV